MNKSEQIDQLATALAKAQGEITGALKDSANPFFKSKYADLASCWDACRGPLSKHGLAIIQAPEHTETGLILTTTLAHNSGQWISASLPIHPKDDTPQAMGSALTYARRYALTAFVGVAQIDDDGNLASGKVTYGAQPAYDAPHKPQGDMGKDAPKELLETIAQSIRDVLDADVEEDVRALKAMDLHDMLNKEQGTYVAASSLLTGSQKSAWRQYLKQGKTLQDKPVNMGRA